ncbi:MAG TPA: STAS domain-containing protein [Pseudomonadales bacterium]|nr:STAS domain-containing protein [Pseudomonadales bacterium]
MSITHEGDALRLEGAVTMATVPALLVQAREACDAGVCALDFSGTTEVDSAAVAFALELRRLTSTNGSTLRLRNLPDGLQKLIALYGVEELLGV